jgi:molybdenum cofactor biosynthesis enzyme MoaA
VPNIPFSADWKTRHDKWDIETQDKWLPNCIECKVGEESTNKSNRLDYIRKLRDATPDQGIRYWDLKINNTCNFSCRMCDKTSSSTWQQIVKNNPDEKWHSHYTVNDSNRWHKESNDLVPHMKDATVVKFTGGEPFMIPQVKHIIKELIEQNISPNVELELITNGSFDISEWNKYFEKFKRVAVSVSIDAIGKRYEYIRPGSNWSQVESNVVKFQALKPDNTRLWITTLPMVLNKDHLHEVSEWMTQYGLNGSIATTIINPEFLRVNALQDADLREKFIKQMSIQDRIHGTDYREFINEQEITQ